MLVRLYLKEWGQVWNSPLHPKEFVTLRGASLSLSFTGSPVIPTKTLSLCWYLATELLFLLVLLLLPLNYHKCCSYHYSQSFLIYDHQNKLISRSTTKQHQNSLTKKFMDSCILYVLLLSRAHKESSRLMQMRERKKGKRLKRRKRAT